MAFVNSSGFAGLTDTPLARVGYAKKFVRRFFCNTWRKHQQGEPLSPMETLAAEWIVRHPEYHADLADEAATRALVPAVVAHFGGLDAVVNNASVFEQDQFSDMNRASWDLHMETNLRAPMVLAQAFARRLPMRRN